MDFFISTTCSSVNQNADKQSDNKCVVLCFCAGGGSRRQSSTGLNTEQVKTGLAPLDSFFTFSHVSVEKIPKNSLPCSTSNTDAHSVLHGPNPDH